MLTAALIFLASIVTVVLSAGWFLHASEQIGVRFKLPSFVLGVLLVGFGTSLPELATSLAAISEGNDNIVIANIIGSNMANILIILGISTFALGTIRFEKDLIDLDLPLLFGVTALFAVSMYDGNLSGVDGLLLIIGFAGYVLYTLFYKEDPAYHRGLLGLISSLARQGKVGRKPQAGAGGSNPIYLGKSFGVLVLSIVLLGVASKFTVDSLLNIVQELNIQVEALSFVGLAIGTSLPELTVSYKSLKKGKGDIVIGNIIGSSIFNILLVGGVASLLQSQFIASGLVFWSVAGLMIATLMLVVGGITRRIHVWEGLLYILVYVAIALKLF